MTTTNHIDGRIELSIPRIAGKRSEMVAYVDGNTAGRFMVTKVRRDVDGEEHVLRYKNCLTYASRDRAVRVATEFLAAEEDC